MKKRICLLALAAAVLLSSLGAAAAAPVAKVNAFPNGEGLEEFLSGMDSSKISRAKRLSDYDDTAVVVVPLLKDCYIEIYETELNDNFEIIPKRGNPGDVIAEGAADRGLLFWCRVPEGMPAVVAVLYVKEGESSWSEHWWSPAFSGFDGSLVTDEEFVSFGEEETL